MSGKTTSPLVFNLDLRSVYQAGRNGLLLNLMPGLKTVVVMSFQNPDHKCSECEDSVKRNGSDLNYIALEIMFESAESNCEFFQQKYEQFNLTLSVVFNTDEKVLFRTEKNFFATNENNIQFRFCYFMTVDTYLVNSQSSLVCEIKNVAEFTSFHIKKEFISFHSLLNNNTISDVTLNLKNGLKVPAHKAVLFANSPYFEKMFSHKSTENISNEVKVDFEYEPFWEVLKYIYCQEIENLETLGIEIFKISHYYQIEKLQLICQNYLKYNLTKNNNVIEVLRMACEYGVDDLENYCIDFLIKNFNNLEIDDNVIFELFKSKPELGCKLFFLSVKTKK